MRRNEFLLKERFNLDLTQKEFGKLVGMNQAEVSRIETGEWNIGEIKFNQIVKALGYKCSFIIEKEGRKIKIES